MWNIFLEQEICKVSSLLVMHIVKAGGVIAEQYNVPCLYKIENAGNDEDIVKIKKLTK